MILVMNKSHNSQESPVPIMTFDELLSIESTIDIEAEAKKALPDDVVTIIYTSGTTGAPKGVMLTHQNLVSNVEGSLAALPPIAPHDIFLSFLPLSHGFERTAFGRNRQGMCILRAYYYRRVRHDRSFAGDFGNTNAKNKMGNGRLADS